MAASGGNNSNLNKKGIFVFNRLPASVKSGESLSVWVDLKLGAAVNAEEPVTLELVGMAKVSWVLRPDSQFAADADRMAGKSRRVSREEEFWSHRTVLTGAKLLDKGDHSYIQKLKLDPGLFPSLSNKDPASGEEFSVRYILRARLPSRDDPIEVEKPIEIIPGELDVSVLAPLSIADQSPKGVIYNLRSRRGQWLPAVEATCFYSLKAPPNAEVAMVLLELVQRIQLPGPLGPDHRIGIEKTVATYNLPGCRANNISEYTLKLMLPSNGPPTMALGPIDLSYIIRAVALFPPAQPNLPAIPEFLGPTDVFILPSVQKLSIPKGYDDVDEGLPPNAAAKPVLALTPQPLPSAPAPPAPAPIPHPMQQPPMMPMTTPMMGPIPGQMPNMPPTLPHHRPGPLPVPPRPMFGQPSIGPVVNPQWMAPGVQAPPPSPGMFGLPNNMTMPPPGAPIPGAPIPGAPPGVPGAMGMPRMPPNPALYPNFPGGFPPQGLVPPQQGFPPQGMSPGLNPSQQPSFGGFPQPTSPRPADPMVPVLPANMMSTLGPQMDRLSVSDTPRLSSVPSKEEIERLRLQALGNRETQEELDIKRKKEEERLAWEREKRERAKNMNDAPPVPKDKPRPKQRDPSYDDEDRSSLGSRGSENQREGEYRSSRNKASGRRQNESLRDYGDLSDDYQARDNRDNRRPRKDEGRRARKDYDSEEEEDRKKEAERRRRQRELDEEEQLRKEEELRKRRVAEELRKKEEELKRREEEEEARRREEDSRKKEEERRLLAEEEERNKRLEEKRRREDDEKQRRADILRQLEEQKAALEERRKLQEAELELERLRRNDALAAQKAAAIRAIEEEKANAERELLKKQKEAEAERLKLEAELELARKHAENERLKREIEQLRRQSALPPPEVVAPSIAQPQRDARPAPPPAPTPRAEQSSVNNSKTRIGDMVEQSAPASIALPRRAPTVAPQTVNDDMIRKAYITALESYRDQLLQYLTEKGHPMTGKERESVRESTLGRAQEVIRKSPKARNIMEVLETEMRQAEAELADAYEASSYQTLMDRVTDAKTHLTQGIDAGIVVNEDDFELECKAFLDSLRRKCDPNLPIKIWQQAQKRFLEEVHDPLLARLKEKLNTKPKPAAPVVSSKAAGKAPDLPQPSSSNVYSPYRPAAPPSMFGPPQSPYQTPYQPSKPTPVGYVRDPKLCLRPNCPNQKRPGFAYCSSACERLHRQDLERYN